MCRCAERRSAIARGVKTLLHGEIYRARSDVAFVASTLLEDAAAMKRQAAARIQAARLRLAQR